MQIEIEIEIKFKSKNKYLQCHQTIWMIICSWFTLC